MRAVVNNVLCLTCSVGPVSWSRTTLLPGNGSSHAMASVGALRPLERPVRLHSHRALSLPVGAHARCQVSGGVIRAPERGLHCLWKPWSLSHHISCRKERWDSKASKVIWFSVSGVIWFTSTVRLHALRIHFVGCTATSATGETAQCTETPQSPKRQSSQFAMLNQNHV